MVRPSPPGRTRRASAQYVQVYIDIVHNALQDEEKTIVEYLSKIFTLILPTLPRSATTFAQRLQDSLRSLLNKPVTIGQQVITMQACEVQSPQTNLR